MEKKTVEAIKKDFCAEKINDEETLAIIKNFNIESKFILDPHTATAFGAFKKINKISEVIILGTAHPYKFFETIKKATGENLKAPQQLEKFVDKDENFDILENNYNKIKTYILSKTQ